jgi:ACS family hexuronate transporter-like MFS transporter
LNASRTAKAPGARLILVMVILAGVLNYADRQIIAVLKPMLEQDLRWGDVDYGRVTALFQLGSAVALLGAGWLVDRIGWRSANPLAVGSWSLAAMAHAAARTTAEFGAVRFALGAAEAMATPTAIKTIAAVFKPEQRAMAFGVMNAANGLGAIATPLLIPLLALRIGWAGAFLATGAVGLVWALAWLWLRPGRAIVDPALDETGEGSPSDRVRWTVVLRDRRTWAIAGAKALSDQVWWLLLFWTPDLLHRVYHLGVDQFGAPIAVMYACASLGSLAGGQISKSLMASGLSLNATRKLSLIGFGLLAAPVWFAPFMSNYWEATAILSLTLAAHQGYSTTLFALVADVSPGARVATVVSIAAFCGNLAGTVILQAAGYVLGAGYGYGPLLALASVSYLLGAAWIQWLLPRIEASSQA